eukprot:scaffold131332_cov60-Phaeocystis_antarctica.AAC.2
MGFACRKGRDNGVGFGCFISSWVRWGRVRVNHRMHEPLTESRHAWELCSKMRKRAEDARADDDDRAVVGWRWGFASVGRRCQSAEGGHTASEVDHHARPLAARWRGWDEASAGGTNRRDFLIEGTSRRDFSKGLLERTSRKDFSKGLLEGTFQTRWPAGAAEAARARWRRRRSARRLPRGAGRASRGARAGHGKATTHADRMLSPVVVTDRVGGEHRRDAV